VIHQDQPGVGDDGGTWPVHRLRGTGDDRPERASDEIPRNLDPALGQCDDAEEAQAGLGAGP
jgi:hypothetical protein